MEDYFTIDDSWQGLLKNARRRVAVAEFLFKDNNEEYYGAIVESAHIGIECILKAYLQKNDRKWPFTHKFRDLRHNNGDLIDPLLLAFRNSLPPEAQKLHFIVTSDECLWEPSRRYDGHPNLALTESYVNLLKELEKWIKKTYLKS